MADRKISDLTALTTPASGDYLPIVDISEAAAASKNKRVTVQSLFQGIPVDVGIGTSSPATLLDISVAGGMARIGSGSGNNIFQAYTGSTALGMWAGGSPRFYSTGSMIFSVNSTVGTSAPTGYVDAMTIESSGRLLVGTSSAYSDYVGANSGFTGIVSIARNAGDGVAQFQNWSSSVGLDSAGGASIFISRCRSGTVGTHTGGALANGNPIGQIVFNASDGTNFRSSAYITAEVDGVVSTADVPGRLVFSTTTDGAAGPTERMRIDSSGNVGIGTTSPATPLHVYQNTTGGVLFRVENSEGYFELFANNDNCGYLAAQHIFYNKSLSERARIDGSGRVGIGTSSPTTLLDVNADTVRVRTARTPASATATGATGEICWDASYIYVCTATNTWKRAALSTW